MANKEKYIGESPLKDEPKKKLVLKINEGAIGTRLLADGAVTNSKIADGSITSGKIAPNAVTREKLANGVVTRIDGLEEELQQIIKEAGSLSDGKSAYEIAVEHGFEGTEEEWLASLRGKDGKSGGLLFPFINFDPLTGELAISDDEDDLESRFGFDYNSGELVMQM